MNSAFLSDLWSDLRKNTTPLEILSRIIATILMVLLIFLVFKLIQAAVSKGLKGRISDQRAFMVRKGIKYTGMTLAVLFVFRNLGIDMSAILGAAGVAGIVFGFAAQTSMSSLISGFFLLSEKPFQVGDAIKVEDIAGVVLSVDFLSVKIRTYDNLFVRIPNETIIKSNLTTITRFPIRRLDLAFSVAYKEDLERVRDLLFALARENIYALDNPAPFFGIDKFDSSGIAIIFCLWFEKSNFWNLKNSIIISIKESFAKKSIEIPYQKIDITINQDGIGNSEECFNE
ncbi:MAG: mechanosensitive ion channel family protein [Spirochaetaceae bacterium]|jgi:small-conductance mechanosensitive channel|nr:mechanosensitive ion channel family protein [Spirochaetaceae bacterium]